MIRSAVILFSGGTDSTCAAAIVAEKVQRLYLLTFVETSTLKSPLPHENVRRLRLAFPSVEILHYVVSTDRLVRWLSYGDSIFDYIRRLFSEHVFNLVTPGFSSLSWHLATIRFACLLKASGEEDVIGVYDGMTQELTHLPGHMPVVRKQIELVYKENGLKFSSPVYDFPVPPDQKFIDRLVVDRHGFAASTDIIPGSRTTGKFLYERGILPHPNVKGSMFDVQMQHDCYPFIVYNMLIFWFLMPVRSWSQIEMDLSGTMARRIAQAKAVIGRWDDLRFETPTLVSSP